MERQENAKQNKKHLSTRFVLILSCALMLCVMITFGATMAYFGTDSAGYSADFILKAGISFGKNAGGQDTPTMTFDTKVLVPGTDLNSLCQVNVTSGSSNFANTAVNGVMQVKLEFSGDMIKFISLQTDPIYVYKGTTTEHMTEANKIARLSKSVDDGFYYLVDIATDSVLNNTLLYEIDCKGNSGVVDLVFNISYTVLETAEDSTVFTNNFANTETKLTATFTVVQSEIYSTSDVADAKTYAKFKSLFADPSGVTS